MTGQADSARYLRLSGARVLTCDAGDAAYDRGDVWIKDGRIVSVGPEGSWTPPAEGAEIERLDLPGRIVLPGLINAHAHSYASLLKGTVDAQPLDIYMLHVIAAGAGRSARDVYVSALVDALTMIRTGTSAVIDHFSHRPGMSAEAATAAMQAYADIGLRAVVAPMFADRPYAETVPLGRDPGEAQPSGAPPDPAEYFEVMEEVVRARSRFGDRVGLMLGVDGPQRCSPRLLEMTADFMRRHDMGLHTHLLETKTQAMMAPPGGFVGDMVERGILNERSSLVHFVWCTDDDIAAAREAGATIVHAPGSNLLLGSGICPLLRLRRAGLPVAVGTDGGNCGAPNMFEKLRLACALARVTEPDFEAWIAAPEMIKSALRSGARALGEPSRIGVIEAGAKADILVLNPASLHRPMGDVWNHLLYYENGASVEHLLVDGRLVLKDGRIQTVDEAAVLAEAEEIVARARVDGARGGTDAIARQYPAYRDMVVETLSRRDEPDRLARLS